MAMTIPHFPSFREWKMAERKLKLFHVFSVELRTHSQMYQLSFFSVLFCLNLIDLRRLCAIFFLFSFDSTVLKSTLFSLKSEQLFFPGKVKIMDPERVLCRLYWFFSQFVKLSFSVSFNRHLISSLDVVANCQLKTVSWINFLRMRNYLFVS